MLQMIPTMNQAAVSEGLEIAPEDNMDTESDIQAIKASMNIFIKFTIHTYGANIYWWLKELR